MVRLRFKVGKNLHRTFDGSAATGRSAMCTCIHTDAPCKCGERGRAGTWKEAVQRSGALPRMLEVSHTFHATVHVRLFLCVHAPYIPQLHPMHPGPQPRAQLPAAPSVLGPWNCPRAFSWPCAASCAAGCSVYPGRLRYRCFQPLAPAGNVVRSRFSRCRRSPCCSTAAGGFSWPPPCRLPARHRRRQGQHAVLRHAQLLLPWRRARRRRSPGGHGVHCPLSAGEGLSRARLRPGLPSASCWLMHAS